MARSSSSLSDFALLARAETNPRSRVERSPALRCIVLVFCRYLLLSTPRALPNHQRCNITPQSCMHLSQYAVASCVVLLYATVGAHFGLSSPLSLSALHTHIQRRRYYSGYRIHSQPFILTTARGRDAANSPLWRGAGVMRLILLTILYPLPTSSETPPAHITL